MDHKFPGGNVTDLPVAILYAEIGTKKFNTFHKLLSEKAREQKLVYVLRHFVQVSTDAMSDFWLAWDFITLNKMHYFWILYVTKEMLQLFN